MKLLRNAWKGGGERGERHAGDDEFPEIVAASVTALCRRCMAWGSKLWRFTVAGKEHMVQNKAAELMHLESW